jgi:hypothetical protein
VAGMVGVLYFRASAQLTLSSNICTVSILLTVNALAVKRDFILSPKRPDPRDLLFNGAGFYSPGAQQFGLAVNHWTPLCTKNKWSCAFIPPIYLNDVDSHNFAVYIQCFICGFNILNYRVYIM